MSFDPSGPIIVFAGPSLPPPARPKNPRLAWRPPAVAGDAYGLSGNGLAGVVLIDGLFDEHPAIRHKELLTLISEGVPVWGAASMGALRAAELHTLGMIGAGRIFAAYRDGRLDADDEVALVHGPAEFDWAPLTEPLVNVRATLQHAVRFSLLSVSDARALLVVARGMFYKHRTWATLLADETLVLSPLAERLDLFRSWLPAGYVDLKRTDAAACIAAALALPAGGRMERGRPPETAFSLVLADQVAVGLRPAAEYC